VVLVVTGNLLEGGRAALLLKDDEVADEVEQAAFFEDTVQQHLELGDRSGGGLLAGDGLPGQEPFLVGGERTQAGLQAVGDDKELVGVEQGGDVVLVGLELIKGVPEGGFSSAAFLISITASGSPLTKTTTSGRRLMGDS
jgi:hypothetical protein